MDKPVISVQGAGKCYRIYKNPSDRIKQALFRNKEYYDSFWALKDVSLEIKKGESYGIIGRNGSGKSTLLQIICGTVQPTEGMVKTRGRIAALLELGSGFNPEFTGLENIRLNAAMLGLSEQAIDERMDDILAFAEIGDFVSQPVKTYSSGMALRLAFAVVAHVDADILVVDEALAVGDAVFVQRCMRFIRRMREEKCLLFVSHDAWAVKSLCSHALWLSKGRTQSVGRCKNVAQDYLRFCESSSYGDQVEIKKLRPDDTLDQGEAQSHDDANILDSITGKLIGHEEEIVTSDNLESAVGWTTGKAEITSIAIRHAHNKGTVGTLKGGEEVEVIIVAKAHELLERPVIGFTLANSLGQYLVGENTFVARELAEPPSAKKGESLRALFRFWFPVLPSGEYALMASIADGDQTSHIQHYWAEDALRIIVSSKRMRYGLVGAFTSQVSLVLE